MAPLPLGYGEDSMNDTDMAATGAMISTFLINREMPRFSQQLLEQNNKTKTSKTKSNKKKSSYNRTKTLTMERF